MLPSFIFFTLTFSSHTMRQPTDVEQIIVEKAVSEDCHWHILICTKIFTLYSHILSYDLGWTFIFAALQQYKKHTSMTFVWFLWPTLVSFLSKVSNKTIPGVLWHTAQINNQSCLYSPAKSELHYPEQRADHYMYSLIPNSLSYMSSKSPNIIPLRSILSCSQYYVAI